MGLTFSLVSLPVLRKEERTMCVFKLLLFENNQRFQRRDKGLSGFKLLKVDITKLCFTSLHEKT